MLNKLLKKLIFQRSKINNKKQAQVFIQEIIEFIYFNWNKSPKWNKPLGIYFNTRLNESTRIDQLLLKQKYNTYTMTSK